ncbi:hypothetical protein Q7O_000270 [Pectobacterium carotovorum subsp. carotovorum PCCS1]|nr:hypothetical protein [Pectobacterium carotovorum subsp. carotovorum PCCS1]
MHQSRWKHFYSVIDTRSNMENEEDSPLPLLFFTIETHI